jgi:peptidoglycan/LPS O-acetylase OafA/YrhL
VEEQFYLIISLALIALARSRISILWSLGGATLISFSLSAILTRSDQAAAFYLPFTRFWELVVGGLLAYVSLHYPQHVRRLQHWIFDSVDRSIRGRWRHALGVRIWDS